MDPEILKDYLLRELHTTGNFNERKELILNSAFQTKQIQNVLKRFIVENLKNGNIDPGPPQPKPIFEW